MKEERQWLGKHGYTEIIQGIDAAEAAAGTSASRRCTSSKLPARTLGSCSGIRCRGGRWGLGEPAGMLMLLLRAPFHPRRSSLFWYCVSLLLYSWMMVWFWDQMGGPYLEEMIKNYPPEVLALFGGNEVSFATMGGFFQIEYLGLMWMIIIGSAVVLFAVKSFASR